MTSKSNKAERIQVIKDIADTVSKIIISLAVLFGGGWALFKYVIMESPSAQVALAQLKRVCSERGSLDIKIEVESYEKWISGNVIIKNIGTRGVELDMQGSSPISIAKLELESKAPVDIRDVVQVEIPFVIDGKFVPTRLYSVLPGRTLVLPFASTVGDGGYYLISFIGGPRKTIPDDEVCKNETDGEVEASWAAAAIHRVN